MRINADEKVVGDRCVLVPYCVRHVPKYHGWMQDEQLRIETCSEPLTLEEEFAMQRAWREDPDKLTFIILDRTRYQQQADQGQPDDRRELHSMVGDVNAFLCHDEEGGEAEDDEKAVKKRSNKKCFELSVMVAESEFRGRGLAREACTLMMAYILQRIGGKCDFVAKVGADNGPSIALFRHRLRFREHSFSPVFRLITFRLNGPEARERLAEQSVELRIQPYEQQQDIND